MTITHHLKISDMYFQPVYDRLKMFEFRKNDRDFQVGDILILEEWNRNAGYTGRFCKREISYILAHYPKIDPEFVILSLC